MKTDVDMEEMQKALHYFQRLAEQSTARSLQIERRSVDMSLELEQKRKGFRLMAELATLDQNTDFRQLFIPVSRRINAVLGMQRTAMLIPKEGAVFQVYTLQGYSAREEKEIYRHPVTVPPELLDLRLPVLVTGEDPAARFADFRAALALPYFISAPILLRDKVTALLVTGRVLEERPFHPKLGKNDVETVQALATYLATMPTRQRLRDVEYIADHDPLTQLPNLRKTKSHLRHLLALAKREHYACALMFADLDKFKPINDSLGHAAGDAVLCAVAKRLQDCVRESDIVGRIGGDEFVIILSKITHHTQVDTAAARIIAEISKPIDINGATCQVGISIGIAIFPDHAADENSLLKAADHAMYGVKKKGRNGFGFPETGC
ncbi:MAG: GGDEF domain-containing protein [Zoogloeaceae bacterium]|jgi:diguanylate cyclase (GGDEF)-like protein|nr:GGDEF domain-containing protein [Zoogloeaceae bacterium]